MAPLSTTHAIPRALAAGLKEGLVRSALVAAGPAIAKRSAEHLVQRRGITVDHTQGITLGIIIAYVVIIAILWNVPYVRWVLWPFKVRFPPKHIAHEGEVTDRTTRARCW